jgi:Zn-dependent protease with chaperone function/Zn-finger nucleic acid-binding protein
MSTKQGREIDYCDQCKGIWLDRGELYHFVRNRKQVAKNLKDAVRQHVPSQKHSPRSENLMVEMVYPGGIRIHFCQRSGGLWFDAGELATLLDREGNIRKNSGGSVSGATKPAANQEIVTKPDTPGLDGSVRTALLPLPNLFLRSTTVLIGLYALLALALITAVEFTDLTPGLAVGLGIIIISIQFLLGPWIMDLSLKLLYKMRWVSANDLPGHLSEFVSRVCNDQRMNFPRFGIIDDGAPQAFTYGHTPNNARVIISRGILNLLNPQEVEAVVAHELGHAKHWDMFLMTIAQLVPFVTYYIYRTLITSKSSSSRGKGGRAGIFVALGAYIIYIVSAYVVLWFSRTREYHADRFAGEVTGNPSLLANALVKIAYGLAGFENKKSAAEPAKRNFNLEAIGALGIFDHRRATTFAITGYSKNIAETQSVGKNKVKQAMRWDLWNPWAKWYELNSTHPLVAHRLRYLSDHSISLGQKPYIVMDELKPESYWDEFFFDLFINLLPALAVAIIPIYYFSVLLLSSAPASVSPTLGIAFAIVLLGLAVIIRLRFRYASGFFPDMSVAALLKHVKVSAVRPVPCTVRGTVIGRGIPGYLFSEDFVLKDDTGIIFLDYRQPSAVWEFFFGLFSAIHYQGLEVVVEGWYRRSPVPFIEIKCIKWKDKITKSWVRVFYHLLGVVLVLIGFIWMLFQI